MRTQRSFLTIVAVGLLTGCNSPLISAEPLVISPADLAAAENGGNKKAFLGRLIFQSEQKCTAFLNELVASIGGINSIGDIVSGALSGVAAFTTPVAASHVLSGTATIVTGAKSALNADFFLCEVVNSQFRERRTTELLREYRQICSRSRNAK